MIMQRTLRGFSFLAFLCGGLGFSMVSPAQDVTITPAASVAYQPFTLDLISVCPHFSDLDVIQVDVFPGMYTIRVNAGDSRICWDPPPVSAKKASVLGLPGGTYSIQQSAMFDDSSVGFPEIGTITVAPAPPTQPIFAFYNDAIGHYFITAGTAERNSLLGGGGGGGWAIVDEGFRAWPADGPAPAAAKPVCRFYSSLVNSHFYTAGANECELLKQSGSGWTYEGIAFRALVPTKGSCYPGTTPVWRLYNDRFAQADSNHRFVVSADTYRHMIANGWVGEGVAFCSPES